MDMNFSCRKCGHTHNSQLQNSVDVSQNPELKESIKNGDFFRWTCPECGNDNLMNFPFLYHDSENHIIILVSQANINGEYAPEDYTARLVESPGELIEKIKIFDAGLDDVVLELSKYITIQELGKDVRLKFFRIDGADSEISFSYPENGQMQLLSIGLNVYEDCYGIVQRNPAIKAAAKGLVKLDQEWISRFFG